MRVIIQGEPINIQVTSVILGQDRDDPEGYRLKMFHCPDCGNKVVQYKGHIIYMVPGGSPHVAGTISLCTICKKKFLFDSVV